MFLPDAIRMERFYTELAARAAATQISFDMFLCGSVFLDAATTTVLANCTGGQVRQFSGFRRRETSPTDPEISQAEISMMVTEATESLCSHFWALFRRNIGTEAVLKVRCSQGLRPSLYYGSCHNRSGLDVDLPLIDSDKSIMVNLIHDGPPMKGGSDVYVQCAMVYTNTRLQRRIRVHTLCLPVSAEIGVVFRHLDLDTVTNVLLRNAVRQLADHDLTWIESDLLRQSVEALYTYKKTCSRDSSPAQLILPESLKYLPLNVASGLKLDAFGQNTKAVLHRGVFSLDSVDIRADTRVVSLCRLLSLPVHLTLPTIYPRLFSLHDMHGESGYPVGGGEHTFQPSSTRSLSPPGSGLPLSLRSAGERSRCSGTPHSNGSIMSYAPVNLPPLRWPSVDHLSPDGAFLLDAATGIWIRLGEETPPAFISALFDLDRVEDVPPVPVLVRLDTDLSVRVWNVLDYLQAQCEYRRPVIVVSPSSPDTIKRRFNNMLVEDSCRGIKSYAEFLCTAHTLIQNKFVE